MYGITSVTLLKIEIHNYSIYIVRYGRKILRPYVTSRAEAQGSYGR